MPGSLAALLNLIYPSTCCGCGDAAQQPGFCATCEAAIRRVLSPLCSRCGIPFATAGADDHVCGRCHAHPPRFRQARACTVYDAAAAATDPLKRVLQHYKYTPDVSLAPILGALLRARTPFVMGDYDSIIPVPLHLTRLRRRGFNQALLLARRLSRETNVRLDAFSLERTRPTRPQVELDEDERRRNVAQAFHVTRPERVRRQRVLLIDDVLTTGATVNDCSRALLHAGAKVVDVLVLARAIHN